MFIRTYTPGAPLSDLVENFWTYTFESPRLKERIFPSGTFEFVFNLREDEIRLYEDASSDNFHRYSGAIASGPYAGPFVTDTALEACVMGIHFRPGGAFPFLGVDADELRDKHTDLETIWGRAGAEIRVRLCETKSWLLRFHLLEQFLISRLLRPWRHHSAVTLALFALNRDPSQMTHELARDAGLSEKRFIDVFRLEVGLNPRLFTRISRFQRVLAAVHQPGAPNWAEIALNHGYFDQSHLIRDFLAFSGFSPADYRHRLELLRSQSMQSKFNHLPIAG